MRRETFFKWVVVLIVLLPIAWLIIRDYQRGINKRYTIGTTTGRNGGAWIGYTFSVDNTTYHGQQRGLKYSPKIREGRYVVEFDYSDPSNCDIHWDKAVPENVEAPVKGWTNIPY